MYMNLKNNDFIVDFKCKKFQLGKKNPRERVILERKGYFKKIDVI